MVKIKDWHINFINNRKEILENTSTIKEIYPRGKIEQVTEACNQCGYRYIYRGEDLECGKLYEVARATYCPSYGNLDVLTDECNYKLYNQIDFLPILRSKIVQNPNLKRDLIESQPCPKCGKPTYTFEKDLGGIDFYDNYWTVCVNSICKWPGRHQEDFEWGSYAGFSGDIITLIIQEGRKTNDEATIVKNVQEIVINDFNLLSRFKALLKSMSEEALSIYIDHPLAKIIIAGIKAFIEDPSQDKS